jgi:hypothetical protein
MEGRKDMAENGEQQLWKDRERWRGLVTRQYTYIHIHTSKKKKEISITP